MDDETKIVTKSEVTTTGKPEGGSSLFNVSIRGWLACATIVTVCIMSGFRVEVTEPLYT